jgi:hypothetical protein
VGRIISIVQWTKLVKAVVRHCFGNLGRCGGYKAVRCDTRSTAEAADPVVTIWFFHIEGNKTLVWPCATFVVADYKKCLKRSFFPVKLERKIARIIANLFQKVPRDVSLHFSPWAQTSRNRLLRQFFQQQPHTSAWILQHARTKRPD